MEANRLECRLGEQEKEVRYGGHRQWELGSSAIMTLEEKQPGINCHENEATGVKRSSGESEACGPESGLGIGPVYGLPREQRGRQLRDRARAPFGWVTSRCHSNSRWR